MRIISGKYKGRLLNTFELGHVRPTLDRVKESIFDHLFLKVKNAKVLDLFGGTGGLGIECCSRGAKDVYICDIDSESIELIRKNAEKIEPKPEIIQTDYAKIIEVFGKAKAKFDIIFIDPPYNSDFGERSLDLIRKYDILNLDGVIVFENDYCKEFYYPIDYYIEERKIYGRVQISYLTLIKKYI